MSATKQLNESVVSELKHKIEMAYEQRCEQQKQRASVLNEVLASLGKLSKAERVELLELLGERLPANELSEAYVKQAASAGAVIGSAASFREALTRSTRRRQLSGLRQELELNSKARGYRFVKRLGISHPKVLKKATPFDQIELTPGTVLKPVNGSSSNGIFIITDSTVFEVKSGEQLKNLSEVTQRVKQLLSKGIINRDSWVLESFVGDLEGEQLQPARDLKFYCFYGKIGFVLEVDRSNGGHYCEWLADHTKAHTGRYQNKSFEGLGFSQEQLKQALKISEQIPAPFMRIDFLKSQQEFVFCEFTPRPGQFNTFNDSFDRYLGELYLEAEARLQHDLLCGKAFKAFKSVVKLEKLSE